MNKFLIPGLLALVLSTVSCNKEPYADYEGSWTGSYSGDDYGVWTATINSEGEVSGSAISDSLPNFPFDLSGTVSESGAFDAQANVFVGTINFEGQIQGSGASGSWSNLQAGIAGSWTGSKK